MSLHRDRRHEAPLRAWGKALRSRMIRRKRLWHGSAASSICALAVLASAAFPPSPRIIWNASASAPIGLYSVSPGVAAGPGDWVIARVPEPSRALAARRHYLPANVPLVKRVAAVAGDDVCAIEQEIFINGRWAAARRTADAKGRAMPMWSGCVRLRGRQLFLLMDNPASFDGRYFGVTGGAEIIGKARLLWAL